jgi:hypothetical protein
MLHSMPAGAIRFTTVLSRQRGWTEYRAAIVILDHCGYMYAVRVPWIRYSAHNHVLVSRHEGHRQDNTTLKVEGGLRYSFRTVNAGT